MRPLGLVYPTPDLRFPGLKDSITRLAQKLSLDEVDDLEFMDYLGLLRNMNSAIPHIVDKSIS
ncbi:hypothetical protein F4823DRAFT_594110 [Ustulina deusta]|nr:hypothetical protein F4823DRAFT_594110 [Ustulina deusta]